jgi:hypothetical protein
MHPFSPKITLKFKSNLYFHTPGIHTTNPSGTLEIYFRFMDQNGEKLHKYGTLSRG